MEHLILEKLLQEHIIGKKHITKTNLFKGFNRKDHGKLKQALKTLTKQGYIQKHPTLHGDGFAIPPCKVAEIRKLLGLC